MKERNALIYIGIMLYVILSVIDRFFLSIPDAVYIPIAIIGILLIITGFVIGKKE